MQASVPQPANNLDLQYLSLALAPSRRQVDEAVARAAILLAARFGAPGGLHGGRKLA